MKRSEIKKLFIAGLSAKLASFDYKFISAMDWFIKTEGETAKIYQLAFYDGNDRASYTISPAVAVRIEEVEKIFHQVSGFEKQYQKFTPTINPTLARVLMRRDSIEIELNETRIDETVEDFYQLFVQTARPFLDRNASLAAIAGLLNENPDKDSIYYSGYLRCYHGAISARLVNRPDYHQLIEAYRTYLSQDEGFYINGFDRLLEILD